MPVSERAIIQFFTCNMMKSPLILLLLGALVCLSTAQLEAEVDDQPCRKCSLHFKCSPFYKDLVYSIVDGNCRVFQNGCIFRNVNCQRQNNCQPQMVATTREDCKKRCNYLCRNGGKGVCATFAHTNADESTGWSYQTFLNTCLLNQYSCEHDIAYIGDPTVGACKEFSDETLE